MKLQISVNKIDKKKKAVDNVNRYQLSASSVLVGSEDACDICLDDLSSIAFSIASNDENKLVLSKRDKELDILINKHAIQGNEHIVKNGDLIHFNNYELKMFVQFEKANLKKNGSILATLVGIIIVIILIFELGLATSIPYYMGKQAVWTKEVSKETAKQELSSLGKVLENKIKKYKKSDKLVDIPKKDLLTIFQIEADRMERYVLKNHEQLSQDQILTLLKRIRQLHGTANKVIFDKVFDKKPLTDHDKTIKKILTPE